MQQPNIGWFARNILGKPLYPYQEHVGNAIIDSILHHKGHTFSIMFARQMGKNQLSAIIEAYLLACMESGSIVKAAPTFKPQIITSRVRLLSMLDNPLTVLRTWRSYGYIIGVAPDKTLCESQTGPRIQFFSAEPQANIVGATASLLLEIDDAQDISIDKFDRDLRPMVSTTNATQSIFHLFHPTAALLSNRTLALPASLARISCVVPFLVRVPVSSVQAPSLYRSCFGSSWSE